MSETPSASTAYTTNERLAAAKKAFDDKVITQEEYDQLRNEIVKGEFGPKSFDIGEFQDLLGRLEGSKMRQQRQKSVEGRRDIMSQGLASMMSNF